VSQLLEAKRSEWSNSIGARALRAGPIATLCVAALALAGCGGEPGEERAQAGIVKMGQAVPSLGFLNVDAARALGTFKDEDLKLEWSLVSGGDPAILAALDSGDIDFAAVGSEAPVTAISKDGPFELVYALMSQMSLDLTVSDSFLKKAGVSPDDPVEKRLASLKGATIGVTVIGGAQDRTVRWLAQRAGLDPKKDVEVVQVGPPPALQAALETDRIDGFALTAPNGPLVERQGSGKVLIRLGEEIPELRSHYHTVLVVRKDFAEENGELVTRVARALATAAERTVDDPEEVAKRVHDQLYQKVPPQVMSESVGGLKDGLKNQGRMTAENMAFLLKFTSQAGYELGEGLDAKEGMGEWWTNEFVEGALKK